MAIRALAIVLLLSTAPAFGATQDQVCAKYGELAKAFMAARQKGVDLADMMAVAEGDENTRQMVLLAYEEPRYATEEYRTQAATDFANEMALACYKAAATQ